MISQLKKTSYLAFAMILSVFANGIMPIASAYASQNGGNGNQNNSVTICHATGQVTNPYTELTVSKSLADGQANNNGQSTDHYTADQGQLYSTSLAEGAVWGDIIPPVSPYHTGLNWTTAGQAIYNNNCSVTPTTSIDTGACVFPGETTGSLTITVGGDVAQGVQVLVYKGSQSNSFASQTISNDSGTPFIVGSLASGDYKIVLKQYNHTIETKFVSIAECAKTEVTPADPTFNEECGLDNDYYTVPATEGVVYRVNGVVTAAGTYAGLGDVTITAEALNSHYTVVGTTSWTQSFLTTPCIRVVTPEQPHSKDFCGDRFGDYIVIPDQSGVIYSIDGQEVKAGKYYTSSASVTVTATPADYFVFSEEAETQWIFGFSNTNCIQIAKEAVGISDENGNGIDDYGDIMVWEITVTNNSTTKMDDFDVEISDGMAVFEEGANYVDYLAPGESYTFEAYSMLGEEEIAACKAVNTASFFAIESNWYDETPLLVRNNQINVEYDGYYEEGEATASYEFTCPPAGNGSETPSDPATPEVTKASAELPSELPTTGPSFTPMLISLGFSVLTYFVSLKLQDRLRARNKA